MQVNAATRARAIESSVENMVIPSRRRHDAGSRELTSASAMR